MGKGERLMGDTSINDDAKVHGVERRLDTVHEAVLNHWPEGVAAITIRGVAMTREQLVARVDEERAAWKRVREAKALIRQFSHDKPEHKRTGTQLLDDVKVGLAAHVGLESEALAAWGFHPKRRRRKLTTGEEAIRVAKLRETRRLRGTRGKRQLEAIKCTGPVTVFVNEKGESTAVEGESTAVEGESAGVEGPGPRNERVSSPTAAAPSPPPRQSDTAPRRDSPPRSVPFNSTASSAPRLEEAPPPSSGSMNGEQPS
jgi:hypothetical protein